MNIETKTATVIPFPDDVNEEHALAAAFARRDEIHALAESIAEMRYRAIALWLGGLNLPWGLLTPGMRKTKIEAELKLIRGE